MYMHAWKIRINVVQLLGLSTLAFNIGVCHAQTPAPSKSALQSATAAKPQPATHRGPQQPLPEINTLIHEVGVQQTASWKTLQQYTYRSFNSEQDLDSHGTVKKTTTKEVETLCVVNVRCFPKLLALNGKPLPDDAMQRQNDGIESDNAWIKERNQKVSAGQAPPPYLKRKNADEFADDNLFYANFLLSFLRVGPQLGTFSNLRRVEWHGRPSLAIDYMGNPHAKSHSLLEGVFRNLSGTVWVDEQDHALERIDGLVFEDYKVGGGLLADVHKGATLQMEWIKVNDEVWLPATFKGARVRSHRRLLVPQRSA